MNHTFDRVIKKQSEGHGKVLLNVQQLLKYNFDSGFSNPTFCKTPQLNPLPILFHLLPCRTVLICTTVFPACDYDQEVMDYELHNALGILWA